MLRWMEEIGMSNHDKVLEVMRSDPKREWTAREIANLVKPDGSEYYFQNHGIFRILVKAEQYGFIRKTNDKRPDRWVLV